jgi:microsomal epoxide hydrolase
VFPGEIYTPPKEWAERTFSNMFYWNRTSKGGHFAAFEQPEIFAAEVRAAFAKVRESETEGHILAPTPN